MQLKNNLHPVRLSLLVGLFLFAAGFAFAQATFNFGAGSGAQATPTDDKGFLLLYRPNGYGLGYQKYDSNAVFQYGFTHTAQQIYASTQRFGKVFSLLHNSHGDTLTLQKTNMATGVVEIYRRIGGPLNSNIGYFGYTPFHFVATQDSGLLVVLPRMTSYNWTFGYDVSIIKLTKTLNVQFVRHGGWIDSQSIVSRLVQEHSDGSIWHITAVNNPQTFGYQLNVVRIHGQTGININQVTYSNMVNPAITGYAELPGRVVLSGVCASNEGWALSVAPDLSQVHWYKRYNFPLNNAGAYELNAGPGGKLYGHMGNQVLCVRPSDGTVLWSFDVPNSTNIVPKFKIGSQRMLALHNPGGSMLQVTVMDSLGAGLCNAVPYTVSATAYTPTTINYGMSTFIGGGLTIHSSPTFSFAAIAGTNSLICSAICNFTAAFTQSTNLFTAQFAAQPIGLSSYQWTFGDGSTSTSPAPTHTYAAPGTYTVCLIGTSGCMSDTVCQQVTVTCTATSASYSQSINQLTAAFTNASTGSAPLTYSWNFGDGATSTLASPSHTYSSPGYYTACLIATGPCGSDTTCSLLNLGCSATTAAFTAATNFYTVALTNASTGAGAISYSWDFGDGASSSSTSPSHTYATGGTYTVCLIAASPCGADTTCQQVTVSCAPPLASFTLNLNAFTATFTNISTNGGSYFWDFGDGSTSTSASPSHTYAASGNYTACLIVTNPCGSDTACELLQICPTPVAAFTSSTSTLTATLTLLGNLPTGTTVHWTFGDGQSSTATSPVHAYAQPGSYNVCLIGANVCGADTLCNTVTVTCPPLVAAIGTAGSFPTMQFTDLTAGAPIFWQWDFGDGGSASTQNPMHTYAAPGTYTVCLTTSDSCSTDTLCQSVDVLVGLASPRISSVQMHPNPASSSVHIAWAGTARLQVFAADGRLVAMHDPAGQAICLDVSGWPQGIYLVELHVDGQRVCRRLVVER